MGNVLLTPRALVSATIAHLENDLVLANHVHTDYSKEFATVGSTIDVERPQRYVGQDDNLDVSSYNEDLVGGKFALQLNKTSTIKFKIDPLDMTLSVKSDKIKQKYIDPAITKFKDRIDAELAKAAALKFYNFYGTPGILPTDFSDLADPGAVLTELGIPTGMRYAFHSPTAGAKLAKGLTGVFVQGMAKTALEEASFGRYGGFGNFESVHVPRHVAGDYSGTLLVNGANQSVGYLATKDTESQTLNIDGGSNSTTGFLKQGDVFTIAGVYSINPVSKGSTGFLQTFVVNADADTDGSGATQLNISPPIIPYDENFNSANATEVTNAAFATVTAAPADNAAITVVSGAANSTHRNSLLMHKNALSLVTRPLRIETGGAFETSTVSGNKVSISCSKGGKFDDLSASWRFDMLFDVDSMNRGHGLRLAN